MQPYFIFKGIDSRDMGVVVNKLPPISKSEKNIEKIEVQGRDGFLTQDEDTYKGKIKPIECTLENIDNIDNVCAWLDGSGEVIFSNQPNRYYKATIINQIDFHTPIRVFKRFYLQFDCQPFGYAINQKPITWNKELLEGLSGDTYDLSKLHPFFKAHINGVIKIDNKQWVKYVFDASANIASCLATNTLTLRPNTQYTFKVNGLMENGQKEIRMYVKDQNGDYGVQQYTISNRMRNYTYTFKTRNDSNFTVIHITGLSETGFSLFSDFILVEGNGEGLNLIENSGAVLDTKKWIKHVGGGAISSEVFLATKTSYPRSGIGLLAQTIESGWCMLANASLTNRHFRFDTQKKYTLSCIIYADMKTDTNIHIADGSHLNLVMTEARVLEKGYNKIEIPFTPLVEGVDNFIRFRLPISGLGINIFDLKLEEGNKATEWQLSPLDKRLYIENKGTRKSKPTITIEGTGDISLYVNKETIKLKNVEDKITINTEMMEAYKDTMPQNNKMYGEFPIFTIGQNNITWTGNVNRIEVQPNTVFL